MPVWPQHHAFFSVDQGSLNPLLIRQSKVCAVVATMSGLSLTAPPALTPTLPPMLPCVVAAIGARVVAGAAAAAVAASPDAVNGAAVSSSGPLSTHIATKAMRPPRPMSTRMPMQSGRIFQP